MARRMGLMLLIFVVFVGAIGAYKFIQIKNAIAQGSSYKPPPETVTTVVTKEEQWPSTLTAIGSVEAVQGVIVSADLSGVVRKITFVSGKHVAQGEMLVQLDVSTEQAQLEQAKAQSELATINIERGKKLLERGLIAQAEFDRLQAESRSTIANEQAIEALISRKTIRAPFSGVLGIRDINLGQHLNEGQAVVPLQSLDPLYVNFSLPQDVVSQLKVGSTVEVQTSAGGGVHGTGKITAINSIVDESTRNVDVQATIRNAGERFRPGMFVDVSVDLGKAQSAITLPTSAISYAPYGNSVFVVEQIKDPKDGKTYKGVSQRIVKLGRERGDQVAVIDGLKAGEEVVTSGAFKLRAGMAVVVDNKIQPSNSPNPNPEDS